MGEHAKRVRIRRKDLRQPDEFETLTGRAVDWATQYRTALAIAAGVLVAAALIAVLASTWRTSRITAAGEEFERAREVFAAGRFPEATRAFATVAEEHAGTPGGRLAQLYRAHAIARQDDPAGAAAAYTEFLSGSPESDLLRQDALVNLGRAREATGDAEAAIDAYRQASEIDGPYQHDALLGMARLHEAAGRVEDARALYARVRQDTSNPELRALLATKLPPETTPAEAPTAAGDTRAGAAAE